MAGTFVDITGKQYGIPSEGESFTSPGTGQVYKLQGGRLYSADIQPLQAHGFNPQGLPSYDYGALRYLAGLGAFGRPVSEQEFNPGTMAANPSTAQFFAPQSVSHTGEVITTKENPDNPNAALLTSNIRGTLTGAAPVPQGVPTGKFGAGGAPILATPPNQSTPAKGYYDASGYYHIPEPANSSGGTSPTGSINNAPPIPPSVPPSNVSSPNPPPPSYGTTATDTLKNIETILGVPTALTAETTAESAYVTALKDRPSMADIFQQEYKRKNIGEQESILTSLDKQILSTQNILRDYPQKLLSTLQNVGVTQAQLERLTLAETKKPVELLRDLLEQRGVLQNQIERSLAYVKQFTEYQAQADAAKIEALRVDADIKQGVFKNLSEKASAVLKLAIDEQKQIREIALKKAEVGGNSDDIKSILASSSPEEALRKAGPLSNSTLYIGTLTGEVRNFWTLKNAGKLPITISALPDEQQQSAYLKMVKEAETKPLTPEQEQLQRLSIQEKQLQIKKIQAELGGAGTATTNVVITGQRPEGIEANHVDPATGFTPNTIYNSAVDYALTGKNIQSYVGGLSSKPQAQAAKNAINNTANALVTAAGTTLPTLRAEYKSNEKALERILPIYTLTKASEGAAKDNLDLAVGQSEQFARTNKALVNRYIQWFQGNLTEAKGLTKFETYIYTASREYAKVVSGAALSSRGLSDTAAQEASKLLNASKSAGAFQSAVEAMQKDMENVSDNYEKQIRSTSGLIADMLGVNRNNQYTNTQHGDINLPSGETAGNNYEGVVLPH